jgi:anthranilate phosphoribosyltransferase
MIKKELEKVIAGNNLSMEQARQLMLTIMSGEVNQSQIAAILTALKIKGESADEIAGFVMAMRDKSIKLYVDNRNLIDVCGTGGDRSGTFNISTTSAFVVAGTGVRVAKHGNRSISSISGSADVLKELGINISLAPDNTARALAEIGICFLFAPDYHPAMKYVAPVRKELAMKTVFNMLGPLTNPAGTKRQVIGTFDTHTAELMVEATAKLEMEKVCFICTENRYDEVILSGKTQMFEYDPATGVKHRTLSNLDFGLPPVTLNQILGNTPADNAEILTRILSGDEKGAPFVVTVANAAMGLYVAGLSAEIKDCVESAVDSIASGKALSKLEALRRFGDLV